MIGWKNGKAVDRYEAIKDAEKGSVESWEMPEVEALTREYPLQ